MLSSGIKAYIHIEHSYIRKNNESFKKTEIKAVSTQKVENEKTLLSLTSLQLVAILYIQATPKMQLF